MVLAHRQRLDIETAAIEVACCRMMPSMKVPKVSVRHQREKGTQSADTIAQVARSEKRTVTTIVLNDEGPHQETSRW
jgi:hypothetical protein